MIYTQIQQIQTNTTLACAWDVGHGALACEGISEQSRAEIIVLTRRNPHSPPHTHTEMRRTSGTSAAVPENV